MKVDFTEDVPAHLIPGLYRMEMQTFMNFGDAEQVQLLDQQFFMRVE